MAKRIRKWLAALAPVLAALLLSGCTMGTSVEELFTLPQLPEEYSGLAQILESMVDSGYEYITPETGENLESLQMVDFDGSGDTKAVVLMRRSGDEKPLKIYVLEPDGESYRRLCSIEGKGQGIESIRYEDMTGDGSLEMLVSWRGAGDEKTVTVYRVGLDCIPLVDCAYANYATLDFDGDGIPTLVAVRTEENYGAAADIYEWSNGVMRQMRTMRLSTTLDDIRRGSIVAGATEEGVPALFITGVNDSGEAMTELIYDEKAGRIYRSHSSVLDLEIDPVVVISDEPNIFYTYCGLAPQDIDGDGVTELPCTFLTKGETSVYYVEGVLVHWLKCDKNGIAATDSVTYHCSKSGWYIRIPQEWWSDISVENSHVTNGEECATLMLSHTAVGNLYTITSENREARASMDGRFIITRLNDVIYAGELTEDAALYNVDQEWMRRHFSLMVDTWGA